MLGAATAGLTANCMGTKHDCCTATGGLRLRTCSRHMCWLRSLHLVPGAKAGPSAAAAHHWALPACEPCTAAAAGGCGSSSMPLQRCMHSITSRATTASPAGPPQHYQQGHHSITSRATTAAPRSHWGLARAAAVPPGLASSSPPRAATHITHGSTHCHDHLCAARDRMKHCSSPPAHLLPAPLVYVHTNHTANTTTPHMHTCQPCQKRLPCNSA
jgi:hypothetical protein